MSEPSLKPYFVRAVYEWCTDSGYTPYIAVTVDGNTLVPREFVRDGSIVLNISALATSKLHLGNDLIEFQGRFGGIARNISVPVTNISAIYARENGQGMAFEVDLSAAASSEAVEEDSAPEIRLITDAAEASSSPFQPEVVKTEPARLEIAKTTEDSPPTDEPPKGKPRLTIVK